MVAGVGENRGSCSPCTHRIMKCLTGGVPSWLRREGNSCEKYFVKSSHTASGAPEKYLFPSRSLVSNRYVLGFVAVGVFGEFKESSSVDSVIY